MTTLANDIAAVRRFSRFYTQRIGLLSDGILDGPYSLTEVRVLYEVANAEVATPSRVAARLELDPGYVSRVVKKFERDGLMRRERSNVDRRQYLLDLTDQGTAAFEELDASSSAQIQGLLSRTTDEGRHRVIDAMREIEQALGGTLDDEPGAAPRVTFRSHEPGDLGWIVQRHGEMYHALRGWDATFEAMVAKIVASFVDNYDPTCERGWIAEVDGSRAGAIALVRKSKTVGQLRLLFVEPFARGLGIGTRLVSECVGQARHVGYRRMVLYTVAGLESARRLYEAEGFTLAEETPSQAWGKTQMEQRWELKL